MQQFKVWARSFLRKSGDAPRFTEIARPAFWAWAMLLGVAGGLAALVFRLGIDAVQSWAYATADTHHLHSHLATLPWYWVVGVPIVGGIAVGLLLTRFTDQGKVHSVAEVIEGAALNNGRVNIRAGLASALASLITLSTGGSTGREGPVVHLAGVLATKLNLWINASGVTGRDLLGCAVAAAVSASFNAPIAGAIFALEVILRHFAVHAFGPIVLASVTGTVIGRVLIGDATEFTLPTATLVEFYVELPAFALLGLVCGGVALVLMRAIFVADDVANHVQARTGLPGWLRPGVSGAMLGVMAIWFPHIIGVGYETTSAALTGAIGLREVIIFAAIKVVAVALTMAGRMGGGVFSPALMLGALTGLGFGMVASSLFPALSGGATLYALAGMGAVAAAVLGAPISTTLIVFELTGDWQTALAVMLAVAFSTAVAARMGERSFFLGLLARRNVHLAAGPQAYLLSTVPVAQVMRGLGTDKALDQDALWDLVEHGFYIDGNASLDVAMQIFDASDAQVIAVVTLTGEDAPPALWGALHLVDALRVYNRALSQTAEEEHA